MVYHQATGQEMNNDVNLTRMKQEEIEELLD